MAPQIISNIFGSWILIVGTIVLTIFTTIGVVFGAIDLWVVLPHFLLFLIPSFFQKKNRGHTIGMSTENSFVYQLSERVGSGVVYRVPKILSPASPRPGRM